MDELLDALAALEAKVLELKTDRDHLFQSLRRMVERAVAAEARARRLEAQLAAVNGADEHHPDPERLADAADVVRDRVRDE